ncbi:MAG TPA: formyltetrahydrofolate deformylase [Isosphaeraceae bacterium]|nr:formyltetrahydrofolate deformylase [Isosphaeraceae bacterium]
MSYNIRLLIDCPDHKGLVAAVSSFIALHNGNILSADQHVSDPPGSRFFMRLEIAGEGFGLGRDEFDGAFAPLARQHGMNWRVRFTDRPRRMAILVSKYAHCLLDLLWRWEASELDAEIPLVISNHADLAGKVQAHGIPFHHLPVTRESRAGQEAQVQGLLCDQAIDLVVLARYMQILSPEFLESYRRPIINIHHSFLPAFVGASPYQQAYARGVKVIGATAHYVTAELDAGPIIHQDVAPISHRDGLEDMVRIGREVERRVLARAVRWHLEDRVLVDGIRTVVFE